MQIRRATEDDYDAYCRLVAELDGLLAVHDPRHYRLNGPPERSREFFLSEFNADHKAVLLAFDGAQAVGLLCLFATEEPAYPILRPARIALVPILSVAASHRRRGVGRALMAEAEAWARAHDCDEVGLAVQDFNGEALAFYGALGFSVQSRLLGKQV
jgi:GNAT superfamily N-acetyltransferase